MVNLKKISEFHKFQFWRLPANSCESKLKEKLRNFIIFNAGVVLVCGAHPTIPPHPTQKTTPEFEIMKFRSFLYVHSRRNSLEVFRIGNYEIPKFYLGSPSEELAGSLQNWKVWNSEVQEFARSLQSWKLGNSEVSFNFNPSWVPEKVNLRKFRNFLISNSKDFQRILAIVNRRKLRKFIISNSEDFQRVPAMVNLNKTSEFHNFQFWRLPASSCERELEENFGIS